MTIPAYAIVQQFDIGPLKITASKQKTCCGIEGFIELFYVSMWC
jgi:hypothetical protein